MMDEKHIPVLLQEVKKYLEPRLGETILDATLGAAGHARVLCNAIGKKGVFIGLDRDRSMITLAGKSLKEYECRKVLVHSNFNGLNRVMKKNAIDYLDKVLFDLGLNTLQLENEGRGFSFKRDAPLDMKYDKEGKLDARDILNKWDEESIRNVLSDYGEEKFSKQIAQAHERPAVRRDNNATVH